MKMLCTLVQVFTHDIVTTIDKMDTEMERTVTTVPGEDQEEVC